MTEKLCFRALFCQISSDENPKSPKISSDGGLDASPGATPEGKELFPLKSGLGNRLHFSRF